MQTRIMGLGITFLLIACWLGSDGVAVMAAEVAPDSAARTWTSVSGKAVEAKFVRLRSGLVTLRPGTGKDVQIPLSRLSDADQKLARQLGAPPRAKVKVAAPSYAGKYRGTYRSEGWSGRLDCVLTETDAGLSAVFDASHGDKVHKYTGVLKTNPKGKLDGLFDVRSPKEFRVTGSFDGSKFTAVISKAGKNGQDKPTGKLSMSRRKGK